MAELPLIFGASVVGPAHLRVGIGCQDAYGWRRLADGSVVLAVADGAGSARLAADGARAAVDGALAGTDGALVGMGGALAELDGAHVGASPGDVSAAVCSARRALESLAGRRAVPLRELACTLLLCIWSPAGVVAGHIGDGACAAWAGERWQLLSPPAPSEYINETFFLTDGDWQRHLRLSTWAGHVGVIILITDGCQRAALHRGKPYPPFLSPILAYSRRVVNEADGARELAALLSSDKLANHSDDDKTILILRSDGHAVIRPERDGG